MPAVREASRREVVKGPSSASAIFGELFGGLCAGRESHEKFREGDQLRALALGIA